MPQRKCPTRELTTSVQIQYVCPKTHHYSRIGEVGEAQGPSTIGHVRWVRLRDPLLWTGEALEPTAVWQVRPRGPTAIGQERYVRPRDLLLWTGDVGETQGPNGVGQVRQMRPRDPLL